MVALASAKGVKGSDPRPRRYILFHAKRHPRELGPSDVSSFLEHVAKTGKDPLGCLEQAHEALVFLYEGMLHVRLGEVPLPQPAW